LAPNDATATFLATRLAMDVGRWDEALTQLNAVLAHQAFQWLERAYAQKESDLQYIKGDLPLKNLEGDPRYKAFLRRMNLPQ
jgi:hypothetical protein